MRKLLLATALALVPVAAHAQLELGLRVGYATAGRSSYGSLVDSDTGEPVYAGVFDLGWHVPIQLDALYEVFPNLAVGVYGSYGVGEPDEAAFDGACAGDPRFDCSASVARAGAQTIYSLREVSPRFVPWLGLGFGYEWATAKAKVSGDGSDLTVDMSGFELDLQLGAEYVVSERFAIGPYLTYAFGQYGDPSNAGALKGIAVVDDAVHTWFMIGLRGSLRL